MCTLHISIELEEMSGFFEYRRYKQWKRCDVVVEDVDEVLETMRSEEEPPIDDGIQPIERFVEFKSATDFKGFGALHNIVLDINNQLLWSDVQTEAGQMYDELRWSFETFQRNINKLNLYVKLKKIMHSWQMTLHDTFKR